MRPRAGASIAAAACAALLAGCGASDREQVRSKVEQFVHAVAHRDAGTLCRQVWAPALLAHFGPTGIGCRRAMLVFFQSVSEPSLGIGRIDVHGDRASVITITTARSQQASLDAIELVKTSGGWRVSALGTPNIPTPKTTTPR
jgi:hypothetical protein